MTYRIMLLVELTKPDEVEARQKAEALEQDEEE